MREIKAFIRTSRVDDVIRALTATGVPGITVSRVHGVGYGYESLLFTLAPRELGKAPEVSKVEVVCQDELEGRAVTAIVNAARTGAPGDGIVFVTQVERAVKVRTGAENPEALNSGGPVR